MAEEKMNRPIKKFKSGGVVLTVWENENKDGDKYNTYSLQRNYKDGDEWKQTSSLRQNDLAKLLSVTLASLQDLVEVKQD